MIEHLLVSALALGGYGLLATGALIGVGTETRRLWRWLGFAAAVLGFLISLYAIWTQTDLGPKPFVIITGIAIVVAHANITLYVPHKPGQRWLLYGTIACVALAAVIIDVRVLMYGDGGGGGPLDRLAGAAGIFAGCGTLALIILARINRHIDYEPGTMEFLKITLICPRCHKKQELPVGQSSCTACGLRIETRIEEPACPKCGYSLYMLKGDNCPECGMRVRSESVPPTATV